MLWFLRCKYDFLLLMLNSRHSKIQRLLYRIPLWSFCWPYLWICLTTSCICIGKSFIAMFTDSSFCAAQRDMRSSMCPWRDLIWKKNNGYTLLFPGIQFTYRIIIFTFFIHRLYLFLIFLATFFPLSVLCCSLISLRRWFLFSLRICIKQSWHLSAEECGLGTKKPFLQVPYQDLAHKCSEETIIMDDLKSSKHVISFKTLQWAIRSNALTCK